MYRLFNGYSLSQAQLQAKAEAAAHVGQLDGDSSHTRTGRSGTPRSNDACNWRGDRPEPELDDLAHQHNHQLSRAEDACDWRSDASEHYEDELGTSCPPKRQTKKSPDSKESVEATPKSPVSFPQIPSRSEIPEIRTYPVITTCDVAH